MAAYVAGELGDVDRAAVDHHLDVCGACRDHAAALLADAVDSLGGEAPLPSSELRAQVLARISHTPQESDATPDQDGPGEA